MSGKIGRIITQETREKIRLALTGRQGWAKGIPLTEEHRKKMSLAITGKKYPPHQIKEVIHKNCQLCGINFRLKNLNQEFCSLKCRFRFRDKKTGRISWKKEHRKLFPWIYIHQSIRQRCLTPSCTGYNSYGKKGIKPNITKNEVKELWFRDKAYLMLKPSIDRIDPDGDYELSNCRFIERVENGRRSRKGTPRFRLGAE